MGNELSFHLHEIKDGKNRPGLDIVPGTDLYTTFCRKSSRQFLDAPAQVMRIQSAGVLRIGVPAGMKTSAGERQPFASFFKGLTGTISIIRPCPDSIDQSVARYQRE
jgi:hypothetical protein